MHFLLAMVEDRCYSAPENSPPVKNPIKGGTGKPSFARVFGALVLFSALIGWWIDFFTQFELPDQTPMFVLIGLTPYLSGKVLQIIAPLLKR